jgi:hypothetical protein
MAPQPTIQANNKPLTVPPPQPAQEIPAPRIPPHLPTTAPRSAVEIQRLTPVVEIWRASARAPQVPARRGDHVTDAYIADNQPVMVRLQFDPSARGKTVFVRPGPGALIEGTTDTRRINPVGECIVTLRMAPNVNHSHVSFHCAGLMTTLTLARNSQARVEASEALVSGGRR